LAAIAKEEIAIIARLITMKRNDFWVLNITVSRGGRSSCEIFSSGDQMRFGPVAIGPW
jgi:hypothetical protein